MARPYRTEMAELDNTLDWIERADIAEVVTSLEMARYESIVAVGSGGSLSAAHHLARLHRRFSNRLSVSMTPYQFRTEPPVKGAHCWIFSAGGSNVDVIAAVTAASRFEMLTLNAVTLRSRSVLGRLAGGDPAIRLHCLPTPSKKDGFLATNSLLTFCALMTRAYLEMNGDHEAWAAVVAQLRGHLSGESQATWRHSAVDLAGLQHLVVLHDANTSLGAHDLESKLIEAGIVGVQLADYRHFAHGRHHWLAKNGATSGVLAFTSDRDRALARRTVSLLPKAVPTVVIDVPGEEEASQLASLLAAFYVTEELGFARGIDPGQPGVPEFGRKLYALSAGSLRTRSRSQAAVDRKADEQPMPRTPDLREASMDGLVVAHSQFEADLAETPLGGVVLDYDGTVVDTPDRFQPPCGSVVTEIQRLLSEGLPIGIATGRGRSAGIDLRTVLPREHWSNVTLGYYNGAVLRPLEDAGPVEEPSAPNKQLAMVEDALSRYADVLKFTRRAHQLTIEGRADFPEERLWEHVCAVSDALDLKSLRVVRSSHSIDVLDSSATKLNVVKALAARAKAPGILRIGDRGRWPGNDHELLASNLGLSVDQVSSDLKTCWNVAPEGVRGSRAAVYYLRSVAVRDELGWLRLEEG